MEEEFCKNCTIHHSTLCNRVESVNAFSILTIGMNLMTNNHFAVDPYGIIHAAFGETKTSLRYPREYK